MNVRDVFDWADHHGRLFPEWAEWWRSRGSVVAAAWAEVLADIPRDEAVHCSNQMARGKIPAIRRIDYEQTTAILCRECEQHMFRQRLIRERADAVDSLLGIRPEGAATRAARAGVMPMRDALQGVRRALEAGDRQRADQIALEAAGPEGDRDRAPRCGKCGDAGLVACYHARTLEAGWYGTLDRSKPPRVMAVRCGCERGRRFAGKIPDYDERHHCRLDGPARSPHDWGPMADWLRDRDRVESRANYDNSLAAWNDNNAEF